ncbi:MAG: prepilin peptidase [Microgenomates group bacterium]
MTAFIYIVLFLIGICCGSFVNMMVYRTEVKYKLRKNLTEFKNLKNKDRSFCDFCGRQLRWYENIPIVSWIMLGGKSKCCHQKLSGYYPVVELTTGILFVMFGTNYVGLVMITLLVFSAVFDLKHMILPDFSTYLLIAISLILGWQNLISGIGAFLFLLILHIGTRGKGMGMGDVKYALFMGLILGWPRIIVAFYVAFISGAIVGLGLMFFKKYKKNTKIAFGPFLIAGTMVAYIYGEKILYYVYRWF